MESNDSSTNSQQPNLPPGFRFHPTDEELVVHYLKKKASSLPLPVAIIAEVDIYKYDPWELPAKASFGEHEWYFFSPRDRKYPNGARPNRAATSGYWKATGTDKPVLPASGSQKVGVKKALVFYGGKPPRGIKTNWIMHEYRLADNKPSNKPPGCDLGNKKNSLRLDDWVLCRIYKKSNTHRSPAHHDRDDSMDDMIGGIPPSIHVGQMNARFPISNMSAIYNNNASLGNDHQNLYQGFMSNNNAISSQLITSSNSKAAELPLMPAMAANPNSKRTFSSFFWNEDDSAGISQAKELILDGGDARVVRTEENGTASSIATLLNPLPQTPSLHQQPIMGSLPPYQIPGVNWYA